jgi:uncharacterized cofD-like protein
VTTTRVVAFGGGHGLSAALRALSTMAGDTDALDITAVVTVGDNGGSSGRIRAERGTLPPGDLRQALAALAAPGGHTQAVAQLFQHRFSGEPVAEFSRGPVTEFPGPPTAEFNSATPPLGNPLVGHAVGNLVLCGLFEMYSDPVAALDRAAAMVAARGRVLPMSPMPIGIEADVRGDTSDDLTTAIGQHSVAIAEGRVEAVRLSPIDPPACDQAIDAVREADWLMFGPGSWFTSVIPHLLVPDLAKAILASRAKRLVILNLALEKETKGLSLSDHLDALTRYLPGLRVDVVLADRKAVGDPEPVRRAAELLGARLVLGSVATDDGTPRHDPSALASVLAPLLAR